MSTVPLHCVGIAYGEEADVARLMAEFSAGERLFPLEVSRELTQGRYCTSIDNVILCEIEHRIWTALRLGRRVILSAAGLDRRARASLVDRINLTGVPLYSFVCSSVDNVSYRGSEIIDVRAVDLNPVEPIPFADASEYVSERFDGITAVGDVHGSMAAFDAAIEWARQRNHLVVLAGDILDYGPDSLEVADRAYRLVCAGRALLLTGNHERKIMRWSDGYRVRLSDGNRVTTLGLMQLSDAARARWQGRFRGLYQNGRLVQQIGNLTFAHAAIHPSVWRGEPLNQRIENMAFFGEIDEQKSQPDRPVSSFRWVDSVPTGHYAVVGHCIRTRSYPYLQTNTQGGHGLFLDTGSGKGGILSSADFQLQQGKWQLKNYNIY